MSSVVSFRGTLTKKNIPAIIPVSNADTCSRIIETGKKINSDYFIPSQFPNLTRFKKYTQKAKSGGKRKYKSYKKSKRKH